MVLFGSNFGSVLGLFVFFCLAQAMCSLLAFFTAPTSTPIARRHGAPWICRQPRKLVLTAPACLRSSCCSCCPIIFSSSSSSALFCLLRRVIPPHAPPDMSPPLTHWLHLCLTRVKQSRPYLCKCRVATGCVGLFVPRDKLRLLQADGRQHILECHANEYEVGLQTFPHAVRFLAAM